MKALTMILISIAILFFVECTSISRSVQIPKRQNGEQCRENSNCRSDKCEGTTRFKNGKCT